MRIIHKIRVKFWKFANYSELIQLKFGQPNNLTFRLISPKIQIICESCNYTGEIEWARNCLGMQCNHEYVKLNSQYKHHVHTHRWCIESVSYPLRYLNFFSGLICTVHIIQRTRLHNPFTLLPKESVS